MFTLPLPDLSGTADPAAAIGPVTRHRIACIRHRIRDDRYEIDSLALATEIGRCGRTRPMECVSIEPAVAQLLSLAIDRLDHRTALLLQLEFVEQLSAREIAETLGHDADALANLRSVGLLELKALLDADSCQR